MQHLTLLSIPNPFLKLSLPPQQDNSWLKPSLVISSSLGSHIVGRVKPDSWMTPKLLLTHVCPLSPWESMISPAPERERLIIQSPLFWTSCFPKIKCTGVPGVSAGEVFINVRQGLYTTGYHFAGCANKAMLHGAQASPMLHKQTWWPHSSPQGETRWV